MLDDRVSRWGLPVTQEVRIWDIDRPIDWVALVEAYPETTDSASTQGGSYRVRISIDGTSPLLVEDESARCPIFRSQTGVDRLGCGGGGLPGRAPELGGVPHYRGLCKRT